MGTTTSKNNIEDVSEMEVEFLPGPNGSRELGRGATGVVYLGKWKGQLVAVKQVQESLLMDDNPESAQYREEFIKEMEIMMSLDNDNILRFLGGCVGANYLITEWMAKGDLFSLIQNKSETVRWENKGIDIALDIARAVAVLHENCIIHRDLKTPNILVGDHFIAKVADVGIAQRLNPGSARLRVADRKYSLLWAAPEMISSDEIDDRADIYGLGVILWEIYTQSQPWQHVSNQIAIEQQVRDGGHNPIPEHCPPALAQLLKSCWSIDSTARPAAKDVVDQLEKIRQDILHTKKMHQEQATSVKNISPEESGEYAEMSVKLAESAAKVSKLQAPAGINITIPWQMADIALQVAEIHPTTGELGIRLINALVEFFEVLVETEYKAAAQRQLFHTLELAKQYKLETGRIYTMYSNLLNLQLDNKSLPDAHCERNMSVDPRLQAIALRGVSIREKEKYGRPVLTPTSPPPPEGHVPKEAEYYFSKDEPLFEFDFCQHIMLKRLSKEQLAPRQALKPILDLAERLYDTCPLEAAWQLLYAAAKAIRMFGKIHDGLLPQLVRIGSELESWKRVDLRPVVAGNWVKYRATLQQLREEYKCNIAQYPDHGLRASQLYSDKMIKFVKSLLLECEEVLGPPPENYCVMGLGSISSSDMSPYSDLEYAVLFESRESSQWEEVDVASHPEKLSAYFKTLFILFEAKMASLGETVEFPGFRLDSEGHPRKELRLRGTSPSVISLCRPPLTPLADALTYSLMSPVMIHGYEGEHLYESFETGFFIALSDPVDKRSLIPLDTKSPPVPWQRSIVLEQIKYHILDFNHAFSDSSAPTPVYDVKKRYYSLIKLAIFDLARYHYLRTGSIERTLESLCVKHSILDSVAMTTIERTLNKLMSLRASIQFEHGDQTDTIEIRPTTNQTPLVDSADMNADDMPADTRGILEVAEYAVLRPLYWALEHLCSTGEFPKNPALGWFDACLEKQSSTSDNCPNPDIIVAVKCLAFWLVVSQSRTQVYRACFRRIPPDYRTHLLSTIGSFRSDNCLRAWRPENMDAIIAALSSYPLPNGVRQSLETREAEFNERLMRLFTPQLNANATMIVKFGAGKEISFMPEVEHKLFDAKGELISTIAAGRHPVQGIEFNGVRFHVKAYPELPSMEYAITSLHNLVVGGGTALSRLIAVRHKQHQTSFYPLIISETIDGPILQKVLMESPAAVPNLDMKSFSQAIVMGLLTNPEDGKSDNIIVVETPTGTPGKTTSQLIGIDNDHAFVPPVAKKALLFTQLLVKNILYCFDEMKKPIHEEVREEILELSADEVLTRWLMGVQQRDRLYCSLFTEDEMVTLFTNKDESKRSVVRMLVPPDLAVNLYAKFRKLQEILSSGKRVTHIDLLSDLEPLLDKYYVESLKRPGPPAERFRKLVESEYEGKMQAGAGVTKTDASRSIKSVLQALPTIEQIRNQTKFSVTDAIEKLTEIKKLVQNIESVRDAIMEGNLAPMKALTMPDMRQRVLARLLWDTLPTNTTVSLIRLLAGMDYISLRFSKCASLNSALLNPLMRPKLTSLDLSDCPNILADSITTIASTCQRLQRLNIRNCTGITRIGHDESNINALRPVSFPALQRIFMRGCTKMSEFIVRAPCLVELETAENVSPKNYVKSIYDLSHASSLEKVTLIDGTIARITRLRPPQPVPAGVSSSQSKQSFYPMMDLAFDGDKLVTAGHDGVLEWWDIQTTQMHHGIDVTEASPGTTVVHRAIPNVILLPPDRIVYALRKDGVYVRDLTTHNILQRYPSSKVDCCGIADGSILLIGSQGSGVPAAAQGATSPGSRQWADGTVEAWDIAEQKLIATLSEPESDTPYPYDITCVVGSGPLVAASHFARATSETTASVKEKKADQQKRVRIKVWDMKTPNKPITTLVGHERRVMDLKLVGSSLFSCSADNTIRKWDCYTGACTMQLSTLESPLRHFNPVSSVQVVDNGKLLMSASTDRTIRFWDLKTGHCVRTVMGGLGMITTARMDGNMIFAGCSDGSVTVFTLFFPTAPKRRPVPQQPQ